MNKITINGLMAFALGLMTPQITPAQGTMTYLSNLGQPSTGSLAVGSDSWLAADFVTGNNVGGYMLNSIQLGMADASGNPNGFMVMLYSATGGVGAFPGSSLGTLNGSLNPVTSGIYSYTPASTLTLSPRTDYFIVLTAGNAITNSAYRWSLASANYNPSGGWGWVQPYNPFHSSTGSSWTGYLGSNPQLAINATAVPEPGVFGLFVLGGLGFLWNCRKAKAV